MRNIYVALENIRSLYNVGSIIRTCSFYGIPYVLLVGYSGKLVDLRGNTVLHPDVSKTALGSEQDLEITFLESTRDLVNFASKNKAAIFSVEQHPDSLSLKEWSLRSHKETGEVKQRNDKDLILVMGNEVEGVSYECLRHSKSIIEIPRPGAHGSLNVSVTAGIVINHVVQNFL